MCENLLAVKSNLTLQRTLASIFLYSTQTKKFTWKNPQEIIQISRKSSLLIVNFLATKFLLLNVNNFKISFQDLNPNGYLSTEWLFPH